MFHNHSKGNIDMTQLATSEVLDLAADAIQMAGWSQGVESWENFDGKGLCLEGGIAAVLGEDYYYPSGAVRASELSRCPAYRAVVEYLDPILEDRPQLWYYNDAIAETSEDVIAVLRAAAAVERVKESAPVQVAA